VDTESRMDSLGRVLMSLMEDVTTGFTMQDIFDGGLEEDDRKKNKRNNNNRGSQNLNMKTIHSLLSEDTNWMVVQAKRKREKDDIYAKNPSFDPIFMKV